MRILGLLMLLGVLTGCTWVKLTEAGSTVRLLESSQISDCESVGKLTAISRDKVAGVNRNKNKLSLELETIAKNEAPGMNGNVIVVDGEIEGSQRKFRVYQCQPIAP